MNNCDNCVYYEAVDATDGKCFVDGDDWHVAYANEGDDCKYHEREPSEDAGAPSGGSTRFGGEA